MKSLSFFGEALVQLDLSMAGSEVDLWSWGYDGGLVSTLHIYRRISCSKRLLFKTVVNAPCFNNGLCQISQTPHFSESERDGHFRSKKPRELRPNGTWGHQPSKTSRSNPVGYSKYHIFVKDLYTSPVTLTWLAGKSTAFSYRIYTPSNCFFQSVMCSFRECKATSLKWICHL